MIPALATGLTKINGGWEVIAENGERLIGQKVVLAKGHLVSITEDMLSRWSLLKAPTQLSAALRPLFFLPLTSP